MTLHLPACRRPRPACAPPLQERPLRHRVLEPAQRGEVVPEDEDALRGWAGAEQARVAQARDSAPRRRASADDRGEVADVVAVDALVPRVALVREVDLRRDAVVGDEGCPLARFGADDVLELAADAAGRGRWIGRSRRTSLRRCGRGARLRHASGGWSLQRLARLQRSWSCEKHMFRLLRVLR